MENALKKLLYRASHRGIREMDIVLGGYAKEHISTMNAASRQVFLQILEIDDQSLFGGLNEGELHDAEVDLKNLAENLQPADQAQGFAMLVDIWHWMRKEKA